MSENNDDMIKKMLDSNEVPDELSPENMKKMLDEKAKAKKRIKIAFSVSRFIAASAAVVIICGFAANYGGTKNLITDDNYIENQTSLGESTAKDTTEAQPDFMHSISDYGELYYILEKSADNYASSEFKNELYTDGISTESVQEDTDMGSASMGIGGGDTEHSETFNQEQNVLEADIAKTDGEYIYYLGNDYNNSSVSSFSYSNYVSRVNIARAENGRFTEKNTLDISSDVQKDNNNTDIYSSAMYIYNDMLIVIGYSYSYYNGDYSEEATDCLFYNGKTSTFVLVYTTGLEPQLIGSFSQDGLYNDVRITDDGYMYLISNDLSYYYNSIDGIDDFEAYVPSYTCDGATALVPVEDILIPENGIDECYSMDYTIISSFDLNNSAELKSTDMKALACYSGNIYCTNENIYTASGWENTEITRFAIDNGTIQPAVSGTVKGYVNDQFSISEYNGYLRIATTHENWTETFTNDIATNSLTTINNYLYVLDMDLNTVGSISDFGLNETIKAVNFNGDIAYVVTYEQTDPLFAIDLSNPQSPVILDEYKILGYSTYMQQWGDGLLLGFGANADENGIEHGVKLVMFDTSDSGELNEKGIYEIKTQDEDDAYAYQYIYSEAMSERKALLIAPEKNIIGVPVTEYIYNESEGNNNSTRYMFFSYVDNQFVYKGEVSQALSDGEYYKTFDRAVYIGDYIYTLSTDEFIASDMETFAQVDNVMF